MKQARTQASKGVTAKKHPCDRPAFIVGLVLLAINSAMSIDSSVPVLPEIAIALSASPTMAPLIVGFFLLGMALGQFPAGICADRYGRLPVLYGGLAIFIVAGCVASMSQDIEVLLIARLFQGFGASMGPVLGRAIARDISEGARTIVLVSIVTAALGITTVLAPLLGSMLSTIGGWRLTLSAPTVFGVVIVVYNVIFLSETRPHSDGKHSVFNQLAQSVRAFLSERQCLVGGSLIGLNFGAYFVLLSLCSSILYDVYGFSVVKIGFLFSLVVIPYITVTSFAGNMANRLRKYRLLEIALVSQLLVSLCMIAMLVVGGTTPFWLFWSVCGLFMAGMGVIFPVTVAMAMEPLSKSAGIASSLVGTFQLGVSTVFVSITSAFYSQNITNLAACLGFTGLLSFLVYFLNRQRLLQP